MSDERYDERTRAAAGSQTTGRAAAGAEAQPGAEQSPAAEQRRSLRDAQGRIQLPNADMPVEDREHFCPAAPQSVAPYRGIIEKFLNWARANSLFVLGFGTGCGAIELRPLMTARFDAYRYGIQGRPTPRQSSVFVIGGYLSVKTLKRVVRSFSTSRARQLLRTALRFEDAGSVRQLMENALDDVGLGGLLRPGK